MLLCPTPLQFPPGSITTLHGPSGCGKSTTLRQLAQSDGGSTFVNDLVFDPNAAVIDQVLPGADLAAAIDLLTTTGLGEPALWLRRFPELSDGQQFRARLARALGAHLDRPDSLLLCDEFCSVLPRRSARAVSYNLRKLVKRRQLRVVLACSHDDVLTDLMPDAVVRFSGSGCANVQRRTVSANGPAFGATAVSFLRRLQINRGFKRDYESFADMHYRTADELGFVDKVFVLDDPVARERLGIVVYSHAPLELSLRNTALHHRFQRNPTRLNLEVRILRRLVIQSDVRGCGLGRFLVRKTLPLVGTRFVECLSALGFVHPVFERAGMRRIGRLPTSQRSAAALQLLQNMGIDPSDPDFPAIVARNRNAREIVASVVRDWYAAITADGKRRADSQPPEYLAHRFRNLVHSRPVYFLWERPQK